MSRFPARQRAVVAAIRSARLKKGCSGRELSLALGESHDFIHRIERLRRGVSVPEFWAIAEELGVEPGALLKQAVKKRVR